MGGSCECNPLELAEREVLELLASHRFAHLRFAGRYIVVVEWSCVEVGNWSLYRVFGLVLFFVF
jgi:hypothetical protein